MSDHFLANMTKRVLVRLLEIHEINEVNEPPQPKSNKVSKLRFKYPSLTSYLHSKFHETMSHWTVDWIPWGFHVKPTGFIA